MVETRRIGLLGPADRSQWIRLRTLIWLRWVAVAGQVIAISIAQFVLGFELNIGLCFLAVGTAVVANLVAISVYPENKRLSEVEAVYMLLFDISQLAFLVYLTGGLNNPFALLILTPVTISAMALHRNSTLLLGGITILLTTLIGLFGRPLLDASGFVVQLPDIFLLGFWVAIVIGVIFLGVYAARVTSEINSMSDALLATQMALAREQKLTDLGGVVAAAAHELGTPLATIKLVSSELIEELSGNAELRDDAVLIGEQADRCRDILRSMGRSGKGDLLIRSVPVTQLVQDSAEPHQDRGKTLHFEAGPMGEASDLIPNIQHRPEIVHGLRNLVQNAVDFARANVWIDIFWTDDRIGVRIVDDGTGFPTSVLGRIGDPFVSRRNQRADASRRPEYRGMGLGLFIAKTLLERSGAELTFANATNPRDTDARPERCGAIVEVMWPRSVIGTTPSRDEAGLGHNELIET